MYMYLKLFASKNDSFRFQIIREQKTFSHFQFIKTVSIIFLIISENTKYKIRLNSAITFFILYLKTKYVQAT